MSVVDEAIYSSYRIHLGIHDIRISCNTIAVYQLREACTEVCFR